MKLSPSHSSSSTRFICVAVSLFIGTAGCGKSDAVDRTVLLDVRPGTTVEVTGEHNLWGLAAEAYGDGELWYGLLNANPHIKQRPRFDLASGDRIAIPLLSMLDTSLPKSVFPDTLPADYIIMPGDSLHFIAGEIYGDRELWPLIYNANRSVLSSDVTQDTRRLIAGEVIVLPALGPSRDKQEHTW
jgi:nucleoid-associated protein YgaU